MLATIVVQLVVNLLVFAGGMTFSRALDRRHARARTFGPMRSILMHAHVPNEPCTPECAVGMGFAVMRREKLCQHKPGAPCNEACVVLDHDA